MKVAYLSSGEFGIPALDELVRDGHEVVVGTMPARPAGRGRVLRATPIAAHAARLGVPVAELDDVNAPAGLAWLREVHPDVLVVVAFAQKLGPAVRAAAPWGCINVHPSLLPRWRGAAPVQAALLAGEAETGVCVIDVVDRMDAGDVLAVARTTTAGKTAGDLLEELARTGACLVLEVLDALARGTATRTRQDERAVTRARKLGTDDGRIRWEEEAAVVDARVRAVTPRPGAFTRLPTGRRLGVLRGRPEPVPDSTLPGERVGDDGLLVACGSGGYRLLEVRPEGGRAMTADEYLRGQRREAGAGLRFGP